MLRRAVLPLVALGLAFASPAGALDVESLKWVAAELPYPQMQFGIAVGLSATDAALMTSANPQELLADADRRLAENPDDPQARFDRGAALEVLQDSAASTEYRRAAEFWRPRVEAQPEDVTARLGLARAVTQSGDWAAARPLVAALAGQHPELWWPHFALAQSTAGALFGLLGAGSAGAPVDLDDAEAVAEWGKHFPPERLPAMIEALRRAPADPQAVPTLAQQLAEEALADLGRARQAAPEELSPAVLVFLIHWQLGMMPGPTGEGPPAAFDTAHAELFELAAAHPDVPRLRLFANFQRILAAMVRSQASDFLSVWGRFSPEDQAQLAADEAATRAILATEKGRTSDAYELAGVYSLLHGDLAGGLQTLRENTQVDPKSGERWEAYVGVLTRANDLAKVQAAIEEALAQVDNGTLRCAQAKVLQKQGKTAEAEAELEAAIALNDEQVTFARLMLGVLRLKVGKAEGAVAPLEAAAPRSGENGLCEAALGIALALTGKEVEARPHIARALALSPNDRLFAHAAAIIGE